MPTGQPLELVQQTMHSLVSSKSRSRPCSESLQSAIFVVEDDSQAGLDHVDGHRAPIQVISPYAVHGAVNDTYYTQVNMIRTIEQILGIHPMNDKDSAATPMFNAFTANNKPDLTPFNVLPNQTSLTAGLATQPSCGSNVPGVTPYTISSASPATATALAPVSAAAMAPATATAVNSASAAVPANEKAVAAKWATWLTQQRTTGSNATPDYADPEQMNRYTWYVTSNWSEPYPGDSKIYAPDQVPGASLPSSDSDS
jgi:hypothetical protein